MTDKTKLTAADWIKVGRALLDATTEGPWEVGDLHHIQGASQCECRPQYGPLVWEGLRDINGETIPTHIHRRETPLGSGDTSIYSGSLPDPYVIALSTNEYVSITPGDAAFIADARTSLPRALDALEKVLERHRPEKVGELSKCAECSGIASGEGGSHAFWVMHPCETVEDIESALGIEAGGPR